MEGEGTRGFFFLRGEKGGEVGTGTGKGGKGKGVEGRGGGYGERGFFWERVVLEIFFFSR